MTSHCRNELHYRRLENLYAGGNSQRYFTPRISVRKGEAELVLPIREDYLHPGGTVHGHVYFKLLDDTSYFAVNSLVEDVGVLTVSFNVYFTRPIHSGQIRALGKVVHQSRNLFIAESHLLSMEGKELARGSGTFMRSKFRLGPEIGYK